MPKRITLEVAVTTPDEAVAAVLARADRLEVCAALEVGGVTPSFETCALIGDLSSVPASVLIRPNSGGFIPSDHEFEVIRGDVLERIRHGADGVVVGLLSHDSGRIWIDRDRCAQLVHEADRDAPRAHPADRKLVFHRAFDFVPDPFAALEELIGLGFRRVLTSGGAPTALEGADVIAKLIVQAAGRIEILPGGGITPENVEELVRRTGCDQVHGSFRSPVVDPTLAAKPALAVSMGGGFALDPAKVAATRAVLDRLAAG